MPKKSAPMSYAVAQAQKISAQLGYILIDVELVKESTGRFLRFTIDKEGGISLDDCEVFHRTIMPSVENVDYDYMEVSSPGADRPLKTQADYDRAAGAPVELKLYKPLNGAKLIQGELMGLKDGVITVVDESGNETAIEQKLVALARPHLEFSEEDLMDEIPVDDEGEE